MSKSLVLDLIRIDGETQGREAINEDHVVDLQAAWEAKAEVPPLVVYFDGAEYWLADGFHRYHAAMRARRTSVPADIRKGTKRDAWLEALRSNQVHGLRRTNADKRKLVTMALNDGELVQWSDNRIAEHIGVTHPFVSGIRKELVTVTSSPAAKTADKPKVGKDGKKRRPKPPKLRSQSDEPPTPAEDEPQIKKHNDPFDTVALDKELAREKRPGSVKKQWGDDAVIKAIGQFAKQIDAAYGGFLLLFEECYANVGGTQADMERVKRAVHHGKAKSHDLLDGVTQAFRVWRPAQ